MSSKKTAKKIKKLVTDESMKSSDANQLTKQAIALTTNCIQLVSQDKIEESIAIMNEQIKPLLSRLQMDFQEITTEEDEIDKLASKAGEELREETTEEAKKLEKTLKDFNKFSEEIMRLFNSVNVDEVNQLFKNKCNAKKLEQILNNLRKFENRDQIIGVSAKDLFNDVRGLDQNILPADKSHLLKITDEVEILDNSLLLATDQARGLLDVINQLNEFKEYNKYNKKKSTQEETNNLKLISVEADEEWVKLKERFYGVKGIIKSIQGITVLIQEAESIIKKYLK